ncbi:MAG: hypothetical protein LR015_11785 [Verrucomicrobia bacterium]|nr:hypothetical protein [Verrucomicrobiota bacterium]
MNALNESIRTGFACSTMFALALTTLTAQASLTLRTDSQADGAIGWVQTQNFTPDRVLDLSPFDDWIVATSTGSVPGVFARRAGANLITLEELRAGADQGANRLDPWQVYFAWNNGTPIPQIDPDFAHFGVSWVFANAQPYAFMRFRVNVGNQSGQIVHFWNHNIQNLAYQMLEVTLRSADGSIRSREEFINNLTTVYYTSIIGFSGQAPGDYIEILNTGYNVGWRGTALAFGEAPPPEPETPFIFENSEATQHLGEDWYWNSALNVFWTGAWPWIYSAASETWFYVVGETEDNYYLFDQAADSWLYTSQQVYPYVYSFAQQSWLILQ